MTAPESDVKPPWTQRGLAQRTRERRPPVDFLFNGIEGYRRHRTGRHAALLSHYGFLSVFPLMLAFTTILGFVLQNNADLRDRIIDSVVATFPIIGQTLSINPTGLHGSVPALIIGLGTSLWAGTKTFVVAETAMDDIWEIPEYLRPGVARARWRALLAAGVIGLALIGATFVTGLISYSGVSWINRLLLLVAEVAINTAMLYVGFQVLTARHLTPAQLIPGAVGAGFGFTVLQIVGVALVGRAIAKASPVYGTFATVIGLIAWLSLLATVSLLGVEANAALDRVRQASPTVSP